MTDNEKVLRFSFRGSYDDLEPAENGEIMRAFDYDRLAAKLAEADERIAWLDCGFEHAMADTRAAEARIAHLENHIEGVAKDTHKIMVAAEAALREAYWMGLDEGANVAASGTSRNDKYSKGRNDAAAAIRAQPIPTFAELMARINAPKPRSSDACDFCGYNVQKPCKTKVDRQNCEFAP